MTAHSPNAAAIHRRRALAGLALAVVVLAAVLVVARSLGGDEEAARVLAPRADAAVTDPLAYEKGTDEELERAAAFGLSQPLYAKSPGGAVATAQRTAAYRPLVEDAVAGTGIDPDLVEAIVFLESGGRPDVIAGTDPARAAGLTQILAETGANFLGMDVDLEASRRLTAKITAAARRGDADEAKALRMQRRRVDARFDPDAGPRRHHPLPHDRAGAAREPSISRWSRTTWGSATSRTSCAPTRAPTRVDVPDLVAERGLTWARVFFDTGPVRNAAAYRLLSRLGDDSPTYYWRVLAAREIMRLWREDPAAVRDLAALHTAKASAEEVLHPPDETIRFVRPGRRGGGVAEPAAAAAARRSRPSRALRRPDDGRARPEARAGAGALPWAARRGARDARVHRRARACAERCHSPARGDEHRQGRGIPASPSPLEPRGDAAATRCTRPGSPSTSGAATSRLRRHGRSSTCSTRSTARGLIAWVREPGAIHVTVSSAAVAARGRTARAGGVSEPVREVEPAETAVGGSSRSPPCSWPPSSVSSPLRPRTSPEDGSSTPTRGSPCWVASTMPVWAEWVARVLSWIGGAVGVTVVCVVAVDSALARRSSPCRGPRGRVGAGCAAPRARAEAARTSDRVPSAGSPIDLPGSFSFPSGHAATGIAVFGLLGLVGCDGRARARCRASWAAAGLALGGRHRREPRRARTCTMRAT